MSHTASVSSVSRALRNSTTIVPFRLLISKTSLNCRTSRLNRSANSFRNTQTKLRQPFATAVIESIHKQTAGQPVLVNRFAQILTEEMDIPKSEPISMEHFSKAHGQLLRERNTHTEHLVTNIRRDRRFEALLMKIASYDEGVAFNLYNELISELATYGVIGEGADGLCEIVNPGLSLLHHASVQTGCEWVGARLFPRRYPRWISGLSHTRWTDLHGGTP